MNNKPKPITEIIRISSMTKEQQVEFNKQYQHAIETGVYQEPSNWYDETGLFFDPEYLAQIGLGVLFLPLGIMAKYVDKVVYNSYTLDIQIAEIEDQVMQHSITQDLLDRVNATSCGNLAYILLASKNTEVKDKANNILLFLINSQIEKIYQNSLIINN